MTRRILPPIVTGLLGTALLVALCLWQLQRLGWKEELIARIEARLAADPVAVPVPADPQADRFLRVSLEGSLAPGAAYVLTTKRPFGPGYRLIVPIDTGGRRLLVDLGFVREAERAQVLPAPGTEISAIGALFWPEGDAFTPDPNGDVFFSREVGPLAAALGTAPVLVVAERHSLGRLPRAERLGVDLPNNHLNYAITWGLMAAVWAVMSGLWLRRELTGSGRAAAG
ncbi:MAG: SURF1 family protein [Pikeienuella sp.]